MGHPFRGSGALTVEQQRVVLGRLSRGATQSEVARSFVVSKNTIAGIWRRHGDPVRKREPLTLFDRCEALHARCDAVLRETAGVGRVPNVPKMVDLR
jgi:transcriptional regulator